ncbi:unnamed protein product [Mesocestoides corti]|uniref:FHA domain-containing protein n=1 Tax=Mesocestoides corti TaxID=53468 RepID=A0A0R3U7Z3_MESCO|nr:unnamed protein product [Mesocestoides corti]
MILTCQHDSHRFEDRTIVVNEVIKVGRAVARSKAAPNNAIFDCKVLSRNHAIIWFSSDEFWLRDTNSSNGTFVNNTRVSKRDDSESSDRQIFSGDVIRFGVDVVEHDTTHGCIVASVTLFLPNGQEARPKLGHTGDVLPSGLISISNEQMFQISYFLSDTVFREQALDKKLETLRQALQQATVASELGWQAMLNEEKLLQKLDLYEAQMRLFKEDLPEGSLKMRLSELLEEKSLQEAESKNQLTKLLKDKEVALQRVRDLERTLEDLKEECAYLQGEYTSAQDACSNISDEYKTNLTTISQRVNELTTERNQLHEQLVQANQENTALKEHCEQISHELGVTKEMYEQAKLKAKISALAPTTDLDFATSEEVKPEEPSGVTACSANPSAVVDASSLSSSSIEPLVKRIVRHNEAAMTSLHAYLRQVNPLAAAELINKICKLMFALPCHW